MGYFVFGKILSILWQIFYAIWQSIIVDPDWQYEWCFMFHFYTEMTVEVIINWDKQNTP